MPEVHAVINFENRVNHVRVPAGPVSSPAALLPSTARSQNATPVTSALERRLCVSLRSCCSVRSKIPSRPGMTSRGRILHNTPRNHAIAVEII